MHSRLLSLSVTSLLFLVAGCGARDDITQPSEDVQQDAMELQQEQMEEQMERARQMQQQGGPRRGR